MTAEEYFELLYEKYGDDFNWMMISFSNKHFVEELIRELGANAPDAPVYSIAKCASNDNVLFLIGDVFRIYHLTYSATNAKGFPKYIEFCDLASAMEHIEKEYLELYR